MLNYIDAFLVEDKIEGSMVVSYQGKQLKIREILSGPKKLLLVNVSTKLGSPEPRD